MWNLSTNTKQRRRRWFVVTLQNQPLQHENIQKGVLKGGVGGRFVRRMRRLFWTVDVASHRRILAFSIEFWTMWIWWTHPVQSCLWCNHRAIQLKKISKNSEKNLECASQPTSSIYKISGSNSSSSRSYKKTNFLTKVIVQMQPKFVFFVTSR